MATFARVRGCGGEPSFVIIHTTGVAHGRVFRQRERVTSTRIVTAGAGAGDLAGCAVVFATPRRVS
ncbi:hypothetical protein OZ10_17995 [Xanthomonas cannabis pv. cannabis]|nr:hypothetical protein OZ10_17995 [Xanthomonas cannabis pv. cannabis]